MAKLYDELAQAQKQPFKYAVFSGGGAKGTAYSGVLSALEKGGVLTGIESVAGSSAGALTASFIAAGISSEDFKTTFKESSLGKLQGGGILQKDAKPLEKMIRDTMNSTIAKNIDGMNIGELCDKRKGVIAQELEKLSNDKSPDATERINELKEQQKKINDISKNPNFLDDLKKRANDEKGKITFGDLDKLNALDPDKFKGLVVTATNKTTGELTIFNAKNSPDVEIALAVRASASIPGRFKPVVIDGQKYVDGGYRNNIPQNFFEKEKRMAQNITNSPAQVKEDKDKGRTLVVAFGSDTPDSEAHMAVYSAKEKIVNPGKVTKFFMDVVFKQIANVGGNFKYFQGEEKTYQEMRENSHNTVILDTGKVGTLSFADAEKRADYLHVKGELAATRHLDNFEMNLKPDRNLDYKESVLKVYQDIQEKSFKGKDEKLKTTLEFCEDKAWQGADKKEVISSFLKEAGKSSTITKATVAMLNDPTTPSSVKQDFAEAGNIKISGKAADHKFSLADFEHLKPKTVEIKKPPLQRSASMPDLNIGEKKARPIRNKISSLTKAVGSLRPKKTRATQTAPSAEENKVENKVENKPITLEEKIKISSNLANEASIAQAKRANKITTSQTTVISPNLTKNENKVENKVENNQSKQGKKNRISASLADVAKKLRITQLAQKITNNKPTITKPRSRSF